ncbi:hypothetical protein QVD17_16478 [Tagetes erecta]|uniref:Uncharacterized protein n=1 Tax=Tagetes erecta TaxID=13708 RepID=A0AAD8KRQ6_TARER|nr:hypothetical protein QVD17_16478 [Tagetes erecta]
MLALGSVTVLLAYPIAKGGATTMIEGSVSTLKGSGCLRTVDSGDGCGECDSSADGTSSADSSAVGVGFLGHKRQMS